METCDVQELLTLGKCFACITPGQRRIVGLALLARIAGCGTDCFTIELSSTPDDTTCNGSATVTITGGTGPFTYLWSDGQTTDQAIGLCGGTYSVVVVDTATACAVTGSVTVSVVPSGNLIYSGGTVNPNVDAWTAIGGSLRQYGNNIYADGAITELTIDHVALDGTLDLSSMATTLTVLNMSGLNIPILNFNTQGLYQALTDLTLTDCPGVASVALSDPENAPVLTNATFSNCPALKSWDFNHSNLTNLSVSNCPLLGQEQGGGLNCYVTNLTQTSVDDLLVYVASLGVTSPASPSYGIETVGGTSAAPSGAGAAAVITLTGLGWNVLTN